jgi:ABC-type branched-subunit amino acid transport system substrate-binding protein
MKSLAALALFLALATSAAGGVGADPGITGTTITIGGTAALSGPESEYYAPIVLGAQAYFEYVNAHGGVLGRKIDYIVADDAYDPAATAQVTQQLVEQDHVFAIFNSIGTEHTLEVRPYLNTAKVPQLFAGTGARKILQGRKDFPWTMAFMPSFYGEGFLYGRHIATHSPGARVAVLYENDDFGKDLRDGLRKGLSGKAKIVGTASYEATDDDTSAQITALKATRANTLVLFALPKQVVQAFSSAFKLSWKPRYYLSSVSSDPFVMDVVATSTSPQTAEGAISSTFLKLATDPALAKDKGARLYKSVMKTYCDGCDPNTIAHEYGMAAAYAMVDALKRAGKTPTRGSLLRGARHLNQTTNPFLQPGVTLKTLPTDYAPFEQLRMVRYRTGRWSPFGTVATVRTS